MRTLFLTTLAAAGLLLSSCNTFIGLGRDMRIGGEGLENVANKAHGGATTEATGAPVY